MREKLRNDAMRSAWASDSASSPSITPAAAAAVTGATAIVGQMPSRNTLAPPTAAAEADRRAITGG